MNSKILKEEKKILKKEKEILKKEEKKILKKEEKILKKEGKKILKKEKEILKKEEKKILKKENNLQISNEEKHNLQNELNEIIYTDTVMENINEIYNNSLIKKWIKKIPNKENVLFEEYNRKEHFSLIADIFLDNELFTTGEKKGQKKRNTLIQFIPKISNEEFNKKNEWLYLFIINGMIVKIGGTRTGLKGRVASYLCGHHIEERGKSGDCSKTNGFIYNTFEFYLQLGCKIEMYGYELPKTQIEIEIFGKKFEITAQTYHAYESTFLGDYKKIYNKYPLLNDNCDPDYK